MRVVHVASRAGDAELLRVLRAGGCSFKFVASKQRFVCEDRKKDFFLVS